MPEQPADRTLYGILVGGTLALLVLLLSAIPCVLGMDKVLKALITVPAFGQPFRADAFTIPSPHDPVVITPPFLGVFLSSLFAGAVGGWLGARLGRTLRTATVLAAIPLAWGIWQAVSHWSYWVPRLWALGLGVADACMVLLAGRWALRAQERP